MSTSIQAFVCAPETEAQPATGYPCADTQALVMVPAYLQQDYSTQAVDYQTTANFTALAVVCVLTMYMSALGIKHVLRIVR